jgi:glucose-6-phosphate 1-epimerase
MHHILQLNEKLGIEGEVEFRIGDHGALVAEVSNQRGSGSVAVQGAQVLTWSPTGQEPVIWLSDHASFKPGKSLRGGAPVCWPWFGPHKVDPDKPAHGFARNLDWEITETARVPEGTRILMRLVPGEEQQTLWPFQAQLTLEITMGERLRLELATENRGSSSFELTQAVHTYFHVGDIDAVRVEGLEGCDYIDKVGEEAVRRQEGPIHIDREVDRIYLGCPGDAVIVDPSLGRRIRVYKSGSGSYVVWNPWIEKSAALGDMGEEGYRQTICVETTNAATDVVSVAPGESYRLLTEYAVETL